MIKQKCIDQVLDKADIKDVVSDYVSLKKKGTTYSACCPFHDEDTPSFVVFPHTGTFKCFGCGKGGNAVNFIMEQENMTFPEAIKRLAKKYSIEIEEKAETAEEVVEHNKQEAMRAALDILAKKYAEQLLSSENKDARAYAYNRWGKDYCTQVGIGFCPNRSKIASSIGLSDAVIEELHLVNKGGFDFFGGRITIPIRDRWNRVIGFTARCFDNDSSAKYINSMDSLIYSKSKSIFGIDAAWRAGSKAGRLYLVEGAPDCMRLQSIGVLNTVAPLGTAWTDEHFTMLHRIAPHLCFLPDADPPKPGEQFGPGIVAVMKSGENAMKNGFSVSVKQIPITDEKQDPDTYCQTKDIFSMIEEKDFINWIASLLLRRELTTQEEGKIISRIASLLIYVNDDTTREMFIDQLTKYGQTKTIWKKAIDKQRKERDDAESQKRLNKEIGLLEKYGFNVKGNKYYSITEKGMFEWSNFVMEPLFHVKDAINSKRLYEMTNVYNQRELIEMKQEDLISLARFKQRVESLGNFIWKATEKELTKLKMYLYEKTETAVEITQLGWQRKGFFAFGNGVYFNDKFIGVDDYGMVRLPECNFYLPSSSKIYKEDQSLFQFERKFVHLGLSSVSMRDLSEQIFRVFKDNGKVAFLFYLATLFRDVVTRETRSFPILNLFGPKGSGKTELGLTLTSFFQISNVPPNLQNSTSTSLSGAIAAVANALVHLDEYKNNLEPNKMEFLKGLWDGTGRTRMNMELDKKKETTSVDSGVILSGQEMPTADNALFSRLIFLSFNKCEFTSEEKAEYQKLTKMRTSGLSHLTLQVLSLRKKVEQDFPFVYRQTMSDVANKFRNIIIEDRIMNNWIVVLAVLRCVESDLDTSLSYKEMLDVVVKGIKNQNKECKSNNELAAFWSMVQFLASDGELMDMGDFRIEYLRKLKTDKVDVSWYDTKPVLFIQKTRIFMLYKKHGKAVGDTLLPEGSLKYYLENSREYLGEKQGIRYKVFRKGVPVFEEGGSSASSKPKVKSSVQRSYCFDYLELKQL